MCASAPPAACVALAATHLVKVLPAPLRRMLARMAVKHAKEALAGHAAKIVHKGVRVLHRAPPALVAVLGHAHAERRRAVVCRGGVLVHDLAAGRESERLCVCREK